MSSAVRAIWSSPGAATKKSISVVSPASWTIMWPPAPNPVSGLSTANEASTAQTAASTALPPSRRTPAPASAVSGWPAATTPFTCRAPYPGRNSGTSIPSSRSPERPRREEPASLVRRIVGSSARRGGVVGPLKGGAADRRLLGAARRSRASVEAGGDDGHPDLVAHLLVDVGAEDDVGVGVGGLADHLGGLGDLDQREVGAARNREEVSPGPPHQGLHQRRGA